MAQAKRTVVILQPGYLPWLGFFEQMFKSDVFVIYDDVQYDKHSWRNRNRIKSAQGIQWLTVPVLTTGQDLPLNTEARIDNKHNWRKKHLSAIRQNYSKAPFFKQYFPELERVYQQEWDLLIDLDVTLMKLIMTWLGLERELVYCSSLQIKGEKTQRLVDICSALSATEFYEGAAGADYIDESLFQNAGIQLTYQAYQHPTYRQRYGEFIPYLSVIDLLMNEGDASLDILAGNK